MATMAGWGPDDLAAGALALPLRQALDPSGAESVIVGDETWEACRQVARSLSRGVRIELYSAACGPPLRLNRAHLRADLIALLQRAAALLAGSAGVLQVGVVVSEEPGADASLGPVAWIIVRLLRGDPSTEPCGGGGAQRVGGHPPGLGGTLRTSISQGTEPSSTARTAPASASGVNGLRSRGVSAPLPTGTSSP
jgi:hypothetical protein